MIRRTLRSALSGGLLGLCEYLNAKADTNVKDAEDELESAQTRRSITHMMTSYVQSRVLEDSAVANDGPATEPAVH